MPRPMLGERFKRRWMLYCWQLLAFCTTQYRSHPCFSRFFHAEDNTKMRVKGESTVFKCLVVHKAQAQPIVGVAAKFRGIGPARNVCSHQESRIRDLAPWEATSLIPVGSHIAGKLFLANSLG